MWFMSKDFVRDFLMVETGRADVFSNPWKEKNKLPLLVIQLSWLLKTIFIYIYIVSFYTFFAFSFVLDTHKMLWDIIYISYIYSPSCNYLQIQWFILTNKNVVSEHFQMIFTNMLIYINEQECYFEHFQRIFKKHTTCWLIGAIHSVGIPSRPFLHSK